MRHYLSKLETWIWDWIQMSSTPGKQTPFYINFLFFPPLPSQHIPLISSHLCQFIFLLCSVFVLFFSPLSQKSLKLTYLPFILIPVIIHPVIYTSLFPLTLFSPACFSFSPLGLLLDNCNPTDKLGGWKLYRQTLFSQVQRVRAFAHPVINNIHCLFLQKYFV